MKILALWAHPRARSSAVGRMMCERSDFLVQDEPFARYFYFSDERVSQRRVDVTPKPEDRFDAVLNELLLAAEQQPLFIKDQAYHVAPRADLTFLGHFENTFLIRDPAQSLPSLYARMPDFTLPEAGYAESFKLFQLAKRINGRTPIVVDADDLVDNSELAIKAYCDAAGIPFSRRSLNWESGLPKDMSADWGGWYTHLEKSRGFARQSNPDYVTVEDNAHLRRAYKFCLPYYRQLHEHRLRIS